MSIKALLSPAKALRTLRKTPLILETVLQGVSQQNAVMLRDGEDGWNVLYIVCHLHDLELIYTQRVRAMLDQANPTFEVVPNDELARAHDYARQDMRNMFGEYRARRAEFITLLEALDDTQWLRSGVHPEQGPATVLNMAINTGLHDVDHIEQITRCLEPLRR